MESTRKNAKLQSLGGVTFQTRVKDSYQVLKRKHDSIDRDGLEDYLTDIFLKQSNLRDKP